MKVSDLAEHINEKISLRKPNESKIDEYAERMLAGVTFPPVIFGKWPKNEKYGDSGIVDGLHRLAAAIKAKLDSLPSETKVFDSLEQALAFMYTANMEHGLPVTEGQRNARIKLLRQISPEMTLDKIAKQFGIHPSSVDRIIKGKQGEGKSGPKGANVSKAHKDQKPMKGKAFLSTLERIGGTLKKASDIAAILEYLNPMGEDETFVLNKSGLKTIKFVHQSLENLLEELEPKK